VRAAAGPVFRFSSYGRRAVTEEKRDYKKVVWKFNGGRGAILCNGCGVIVAEDVIEPVDAEYYCNACVEVAKVKEKPDLGRVACWRVFQDGGARVLQGVLLDTRPSYDELMSRIPFVSEPKDGKVEAEEGIYTLVGEEADQAMISRAHKLFESSEPVDADEGIAYMLAASYDWMSAKTAVCGAIDRTLPPFAEFTTIRIVISWLAMSEDSVGANEVAFALRVGLEKAFEKVTPQQKRALKYAREALHLVSADRLTADDMSRTATIVHGSAEWAVDHGRAAPAEASALSVAWRLLSYYDGRVIGTEDREFNRDPLVAAQCVAEDLMTVLAGAQPKSKSKPATPGGIVVLKAMPDVARTSHTREIERSYERIAGKKFPYAVASDLQRTQATLAAEFPYAVEQIAVLLGDLRENEPISFRNTLLVSGPGVGKSRLVRRICEIVGVGLYRFDGANAMDNSFGGTPRRWSTGEHCAPLDAIIRTGICGPVLLCDEIEKAGHSRYNGALEDSILPFLEKETASKYPDPFVCAEVDVSAVSFLATANDDTKLSGPLRDRLRTIRIPAPTADHMPEIARTIVSDIARERGGAPEWWPHLSEDEHEVVWRLWKGGSVRRLRVLVERVLAQREKNPRQ
jgi:hypothetical protein